jgi:hypothetical protein
VAGRKKKVAIGCAVVLVLLLGGGFLFMRRFLVREEVPGVVPIATTAEYQDRALLETAWALPVASRYHAGFFSQPNGSVCGPTSVANVLRSRGRARTDVDRVLDGTGECWTGMCFGGLTLDQLAEVARHAGAGEVTVLRDLTLAEFREHLAHANDADRRYTINFDRGPLFAYRGGHHSPIAGYLADRDLVFVLDTNDKYGPWLVDADRLYEAMDTVDPSSGRKRGMLLYQ